MRRRTRKQESQQKPEEDLEFQKTLLAGIEDDWLMARIRGETESTERLLDEDYYGSTSDGMPQTKADFVRFVADVSGCLLTDFRLGIRVRVTESMVDGRKPRRIQRELNDTVKGIIRMPWHVPVFVVTDSEYIQQMLASHFHDARFLPKRFASKEVGGGYIDRHGAAAMRTFLTELICLSACRKILNVGGFVNDESIWEKMIWPPYDGAVVPVRASQK